MIGFNNLVAVKRASCRTTKSLQGEKPWSNLIETLEVSREDQVWVADITYVRLKGRFIYLAVVMDVFTRMIKAWHLSPHFNQSLTLKPLEEAFCTLRNCGLNKRMHFTALGTAFYALKHDPNFREGSVVRATGYLAQIYGQMVFVVLELARGTSHANRVIDSEMPTLEQLKHKAQSNLFMSKAKLFCLLDAFPEASAQAYALAVQLRRQHHDRSEATAIAEQDAVCSDCRARVQFEPKHAFNFSQARCPKCERTVDFRRVEPIPTQEKQPPSLEEIQARLKKRFGT